MSGKLLVPFAPEGGPLVGPTGQPLEVQPKPDKPPQKVPWVTAVFEQYPAGVFGVVQIRELVTGEDGIQKLQMLKTEILMPDIAGAMKKARHLVLDRVNKPQGKNGKSHLHVVKKG